MSDNNASLGMCGYPLSIQIIPSVPKSDAAPTPAPVVDDEVVIDGKRFALRGNCLYDESGKEYQVEVRLGVANGV